MLHDLSTRKKGRKEGSKKEREEGEDSKNADSNDVGTVLGGAPSTVHHSPSGDDPMNMNSPESEGEGGGGVSLVWRSDTVR